MWKDFKHHLVWELGDRWTLSILVGLQPASDPAAVASLLLVLPHRQDGVSSHLQREGEPVTSVRISPVSLLRKLDFWHFFPPLRAHPQPPR